jgi:hypothetical protein
MSLCIEGLYVTLSITDTQHNKALNYAECHHDKYRVLFIVMLNVVMLNVVMLCVVAPLIMFDTLSPVSYLFRKPMGHF